MGLEKEKIDIDSLFDDLNHPNPYINNLAIEIMNRLYPEQSIQRLIQI